MRGVGEGYPTIRRNHEVATHLAQILAPVRRAGAAALQVQAQVGRQRFGGERAEPGAAAQAERPVGRALFVGQTAKWQAQASAVAADTSRRIEGHDKHLGAFRVERGLLLAQLRQVVCSVQSPEPAEEDEDHPPPAIVRKGHRLPIGPKDGEVRRQLSDSHGHGAVILDLRESRT